MVKAVVATAALGLVLTPAIAAEQIKKRAPAISLSFDPISSFTPATADPKLAAELASKADSRTDFRFTPAAAKSRPSQVRVAIRARSIPSRVGSGDVPTTSAAALSAITPASYNLGVAVGWRQFAVSGDVQKTKAGDAALGGRESAALGVSYSLKRFTGRVAASADRSDGEALTALRNEDNYSLDVGGSYALSNRIAVTGGVRYRIDRDRFSALSDDRRDSQAVYIGTALKF